MRVFGLPGGSVLTPHFIGTSSSTTGPRLGPGGRALESESSAELRHRQEPRGTGVPAGGAQGSGPAAGRNPLNVSNRFVAASVLPGRVLACRSPQARSHQPVIHQAELGLARRQTPHGVCRELPGAPQQAGSAAASAASLQKDGGQNQRLFGSDLPSGL